MLPLGKACPTLVEGGAAHSTEGFSYVVGSKSSPTISGSFVWFWGWVGILWWLPLTASHAQITLDGTVGPKGNLLGPNYTIGADVGRQVGGNLFHSFGEFNVHTGESATFTGSTSIQNVIGRVTGGQASEINGTLSSKIPNANLYLLNPAGVLFGPDARLDVLGSFHVSTADYLKLGDDGRFDATQPSNSVLTSAPPSAFGFLGSNPAPISIQNSLLQVPEGQTLSVIGGDITVMGTLTKAAKEEETNLGAPRGKVQIASVASPGEVVPRASAQAPDLDVSGFARLGGIEVSQGLISTQGKSGGSVIIRGGRLEVTGGAVIRSNTVGSGDGGEVDIAATESITIAGHLAGEPDEVSRVNSHTTNRGNAGRVSVSAPTLVIDGGDILTPALPKSAGDGGEIKVNVGRLTISNGGQIQSPARKGSTGDAGTVTVTATDSIFITGRRNGSNGDRSGLLSQTAGDGNAGTVTVFAPTATLAIEQGGAISTSVREESPGKGGNIKVNVGRLTLTSGGRIVSDTTKDATGDAGTVTVTAADSITIAGQCCEGDRSGLVTSTRGKGQGGDITVHAPHITLDDGIISASSFIPPRGGAGTSQGNAGNLQIHATETFRSRNGGGVTTSAAQAGGGKIDLSAGSLVELVNSEVTTTVGGRAGDAGGITIDSRSVVLNDSRVTSQAVEGRGGNIRIKADALLRSPASTVNASSKRGVSGTVDIRGVVNNLSGSLAPLTQAYQDSPALAADRCAGRLQEGAVSSFVVTGRSGIPLQPGGLLPSASLMPTQGTEGRQAVTDQEIIEEQFPSAAQFVWNEVCPAAGAQQ